MRDLDFDAVQEFRDLIRFATGTAVDCDVARMESHCSWRVIVSATRASRTEIGATATAGAEPAHHRPGEPGLHHERKT